MKKLFLAIACIVFCLTKTQAQNDAILTVEKTQVQVSQQLQNDTTLTTEEIRVANDYQIRDNRSDTILTIEQVQVAIGHQVHVCANKYDHVLVYAPQGCTGFCWATSDDIIYDVNPFDFDGNLANYYVCTFYGCGYNFTFGIYFDEPNVPNETTEELWKRQHESITLEAPSGSYSYLWNTGATTSTIEVTEPGTYTCDVSDMCATSVQTFIVQDNVEIDLATCDLESNLNLITWQTNPAQALYIDHVIVKRDGMQVGTAPYSDGQFTDNIGSGSASRTYTLTAIATDGTGCPIVSYPKETIHMAYLTGINNTIEVNWNVPAGYDLLGYNICEWHPRKSRPSGGADPQNCGAEGVKDGDLTVIDFVGASVTSYTCSENQFNDGHVVVQGVENGRTESRLLSNRSEEGIVGIGEEQNKTFKLYPNPSNGEFTVEGTTDLTVFNTLGQVITTSHSENARHSISLRTGVYFVKSDEGVVQKVVVE